MWKEYPHQELTGRIIAAFYELYRRLGYGYLESVYRRGLAVELQYRGLSVAREVSYPLLYRGVSIGTYRADLVVESKVIVEVKTGLHLDPSGPPQLLNYVKVSSLPVGLLLHVGPQPEVRRIIGARGDVERLR